MKNHIIRLAVTLFIVACGINACKTTQDSAEGDTDAIEVSDREKLAFEQQQNDTINIASDSTEYQIIIIDPGFNTWLLSIARPEGYYSQTYLENRNQIYVMNWNQRAMQPLRFGGDLYQMQIDYDPGIDYGYEVNYKLYNYFIFFQRKYNQRLGPWLPRI